MQSTKISSFSHAIKSTEDLSLSERYNIRFSIAKSISKEMRLLTKELERMIRSQEIKKDE